MLAPIKYLKAMSGNNLTKCPSPQRSWRTAWRDTQPKSRNSWSKRCRLQSVTSHLTFFKGLETRMICGPLVWKMSATHATLIVFCKVCLCYQTSVQRFSTQKFQLQKFHCREHVSRWRIKGERLASHLSARFNGCMQICCWLIKNTWIHLEF